MDVKLLTAGALSLAATLAACTAKISGTGPDGASPVAGHGPGGGTAAAAAGKLNLQGAPMHYRVVRLANTQWTNSVQSVLRLASPPSYAELFQNAVSGTTDFTNNELVLDIDSRGWSDYRAAAEALAAQVALEPQLLSQVYSGTDGPGFIAAVGKRVYRRPLSMVEQAAYQQLFDAGPSFSGTQSAFAKGASLVLEAMLQSPYFLYRTELGPAGARLSPYEMAAKLSLWLRDTTPDDALLDSAAGPGKLDTPTGAAALAQQMLTEPTAKAVMRAFHGQFLHFGRFANHMKVGVPSYDPAINAELEEASYLFFDKVFSQGLGVKDVFLARTGFAGPLMAPLYGGGGPASGFTERELGANRVGYFTQLPFLLLYAHNDDPDPIHRGVSMSLDVLCAPLGPPADVVPPLPDPKPGQTNRMRVDEHTKGCGTVCHNNMINPLGFAFENFDGMGQYREIEMNGSEELPIDASGSFDFVDGPKAYKTASDLMQVLATDPQTHLCYTKKLASFGLQRDVVEADLPLLDELSSVSMSAGGSLKQVIVDLVKQDSFGKRVGGVQ